MGAKQEIRFYDHFLYREPKVKTMMLLMLSLSLLCLPALCLFNAMCKGLCKHLTVIQSRFCQIIMEGVVIKGFWSKFPVSKATFACIDLKL